MTEQQLHKALCYHLPWSIEFEDVFGNVYDLTPELFIAYGKNIKPILHSLDKLTQEIDHKGERFVPMKRLNDLLQQNQFCKDKYLKNNKFVNYVRSERKTYKFNDEIQHEVEYLQESSNMGVLNIVFGYSEKLNRFYEYDKSRNITHATAYQFELFEKLLEWHFNLFLPKELYIEKS